MCVRKEGDTKCPFFHLVFKMDLCFQKRIDRPPSRQTVAMATISKDTLYTVLAKVEELSLPEGEYLSLCNLLKKQFDTLPPEVLCEYPRSNTVVFHGKRVITIKLHKQIVYKAAKQDEYVYSINDVQKQGTAMQCAEALARLHTLNHTRKIVLDGEFETTLRDDKKYLEETAPYVDEDDDDYLDLRASYILGRMLGVHHD